MKNQKRFLPRSNAKAVQNTIKHCYSTRQCILLISGLKIAIFSQFILFLSFPSSVPSFSICGFGVFQGLGSSVTPSCIMGLFQGDYHFFLNKLLQSGAETGSKFVRENRPIVKREKIHFQRKINDKKMQHDVFERFNEFMSSLKVKT